MKFLTGDGDIFYNADRLIKIGTRECKDEEGGSTWDVMARFDWMRPESEAEVINFYETKEEAQKELDEIIEELGD